MNWEGHKPYVLPGTIFLAGLIVRIVLIDVHPAVFGGDTVLRLANRDQILLAYQLPVLQAAIVLISEFTSALLPVRYFMAVIGAGSGVAFYYLARHFIEPGKAFWAALLLVSNPSKRNYQRRRVPEGDVAHNKGEEIANRADAE